MPPMELFSMRENNSMWGIQFYHVILHVILPMSNTLLVLLNFSVFSVKATIRCHWRASVASETLTGVTQSKIGDVYKFIYLFVYMFGRTYVILYFDPRVFVLVMWSTPSQIALNIILWFFDQYP